MQAGLQTDMIFRELCNAGLSVVCEASACPNMVRDIYRAAVFNKNPKLAMVLTRRVFDRIDQISAQLANFNAQLAALAAEIQATIPPEPQASSTPAENGH